MMRSITTAERQRLWNTLNQDLSFEGGLYAAISVVDELKQQDVDPKSLDSELISKITDRLAYVKTTSLLYIQTNNISLAPIANQNIFHAKACSALGVFDNWLNPIKQMTNSQAQLDNKEKYSVDDALLIGTTSTNLGIFSEETDQNDPDQSILIQKNIGDEHSPITLHQTQDISRNVQDELISKQKISKTVRVDKAWGFFNNLHDSNKFYSYFRHPPPQSLPEEWELRPYRGRERSIDAREKFNQFWRFDLLRPLYHGWEDWFEEFFYMVNSLLKIIPGCLGDIGTRLRHDLKNEPIRMFIYDLFRSLYAILYHILATVISFTLSLLGLLTRPIMTVILGTKDPELQLEITYVGKDEERNKGIFEFCYLKGGQPTPYKGTHKSSYFTEKLPPDSQLHVLADDIIEYMRQNGIGLHAKASEKDMPKLTFGLC